MTNQLEALKKLHNSIHGQYYLGQDEERKLIDAIYKQALAEAEKQEPVKEINLAYMKGVSDTFEILNKQKDVLLALKDWIIKIEKRLAKLEQALAKEKEEND